jgi:drug/metabolite transporter (DMT)-like permease
LSAFSYGGADFLGGVLARKVSPILVVLWSQVIGFVPLICVYFFVPATFDAASCAWGAAAGLVGGAGVGLLYRGLAIGRMTVVAPITGVIAAALPATFGFVTGERPATLALIGVLLALISVVLVSRGDAGAGSVGGGDEVEGSPAIPLAIAAGLAFGGFFILLARSDADSGLWPVMSARLAACLVYVAAVFVTRTPALKEKSHVVAAGLVGLMDVVAIVLFVYAARLGLLSLVSVLASMYPAITVLLARTVLKERFNTIQVAGLILAGTAIILIVTPT